MSKNYLSLTRVSCKHACTTGKFFPPLERLEWERNRSYVGCWKEEEEEKKKAHTHTHKAICDLVFWLISSVRLGKVFKGDRETRCLLQEDAYHEGMTFCQTSPHAVHSSDKGGPPLLFLCQMWRHKRFFYWYCIHTIWHIHYTRTHYTQDTHKTYTHTRHRCTLVLILFSWESGG